MNDDGTQRLDSHLNQRSKKKRNVDDGKSTEEEIGHNSTSSPLSTEAARKLMRAQQERQQRRSHRRRRIQHAIIIFQSMIEFRMPSSRRRVACVQLKMASSVATMIRSYAHIQPIDNISPSPTSIVSLVIKEIAFEELFTHAYFQWIPSHRLRSFRSCAAFDMVSFV